MEVFGLLVAACPSYEGSTHAAGADEMNGEYLRVGQVICHLIDLLDDGRTRELPAVFDVVDWVLEEGDDEARSLIGAGFLDDLTDRNLYGNTTKRPADFRPWLGPHALQHPSVQRVL